MKIHFLFLLAIASSVSLLKSNAAEDIEHFGGIGVVIAQLYDQDETNHLGELVVLDVPPNSIAAKAGIKGGDVIVAVDEQAIKGNSFTDIVRKNLRGAVGSPVRLKIRRIGQKTDLDFKLTRVAMKG